ncbi:DUF402 domain-containing protein [Clostridium folliculivorans]|uniref:DUF402 domain-containing protein n=1 Tax=Clostridium folliculivorans TaxID=2886038 RepID=A0A9W5Y6F4_9CLOT|nr:DUF402 domain-containing protein [Clostridium folliculivorans]GKU27442.1 hypothetical protein CFOLD11_42690 [Clostridium folliculivorans]GKU32294.1 hypothetical protein CFB3_44020 [Clostridium folliculivorans]
MIKEKYANKPGWTRVLKRKFTTRYFKNDDFEGYVSVTRIEKVREPLIKNMLGKDYCLVDDGYIWLEIVPFKGNYCMTTMYDSNKEIVQWYFDITRKKGLTDEGIPFFEDLFLDVVVLPDSNVLLLDENELKDAFDKGEITQQEFDMAYTEAKEIMNNIAVDVNKLSDFSNKYLNEFFLMK